MLLEFLMTHGSGQYAASYSLLGEQQYQDAGRYSLRSYRGRKRLKEDLRGSKKTFLYFPEFILTECWLWIQLTLDDFYGDQQAPRDTKSNSRAGEVTAI